MQCYGGKRSVTSAVLGVRVQLHGSAMGYRVSAYCRLWVEGQCYASAYGVRVSACVLWGKGQCYAGYGKVQCYAVLRVRVK